MEKTTDRMEAAFKTMDIIAAIGLYGVSTTFSILLFSRLAPPDVISQVTFRTFAVVFELSKIVLWAQGVSKNNNVFKVIALSMTLCSLVASAVSIVSEQQDRDSSAEVAREISGLEVDSLSIALTDVDEELLVTKNRLEAGTGIAEDNRRRIDELRIQRNDILLRLSDAKQKRAESNSAIQGSASSENPLSALAKAFSLQNADLFRLIYSGLLCLLLEAGGLATVHSAIKAGKKSNQEPLLYINVGDLSHISLHGDNKSACGMTLRGELSSNPTGNVCIECMSKKLANRR